MSAKVSDLADITEQRDSDQGFAMCSEGLTQGFMVQGSLCAQAGHRENGRSQVQEHNLRRP